MGRSSLSDAFSREEIERYARHLILPEFGAEGQRKLKAAKVLVVGAGGLGSPVLLYLAAAGIGTIGIVDFDRVDDSNLQRQVLFSTQDVGAWKADAAARRVRALNPHIEVRVHRDRLDSTNALDIIRDYDIVADGADNFPTRYLVNDACVLLGKTNVYAAIFRFDGQVSVFNHPGKNGQRGPDYRDLYPEPPPPGSVPSCAEGGVLGVLPGIIGSLQAGEALKCAAGIGEVLSGRLFVLDALHFEARTLRFERKEARQPIRALIDYDVFCGASRAEGDFQGESAIPDGTAKALANSATHPVNTMLPQVKEISVHELKALRENGTPYQLIDVREPLEYEIVHIEGELIPLAEVVIAEDRIARDRQVILHCKSGVRSANCIRVLEQRFGFENLYNLKGGVLAWVQEIDTTLPQY